jgi:ribosomal protein L32E
MTEMSGYHHGTSHGEHPLTIADIPPGSGPWGITGQDVDTRSLSYDELADLLGIERESARHLVFRRRWRRTKGNDGKTRVEVPLEMIPTPKLDTPTGHGPLSPTGPATDMATGLPTGADAIFTRHIERLETMLADAQARLTAAEVDRDAARGEARDAVRAKEAIEAQIAVLNAALNMDRKRAENAISDRDAWRSQAERLTALTERRSWWKRLVG